jgi:hypothetical protein
MRLTVLICLLCSSCASHPFQEWSKADTYRQIGWSAIHAVDWQQTREIAVNDAFIEKNSIMGDYPTVQKVDIYFGVTLVMHTLISGFIAPEYRSFWQYGSVVAGTVNVGRNYIMGVRF